MLEIDQIDACVVGGGPAGSTSALRLAQLGHRVALIERACFPRSHVGESLTHGVQTFFEILGLREAWLNLDSVHAPETLVRWDKAETESLTGVDNPGSRTVNRGRFDALLLKAAQVAGVEVIQPAFAYRIASSESGWRLDIRSESRSRSIQTKFLVDATGRKSFLSGKRTSTSPPTLALCGLLQDARPPQPTRIEAIADGWCWGASVPDNLFSAMVFIDPHTVRRRKLEGLEGLWRSQLTKAALFVDISALPLAQAVVALHAGTSFAIESIGTNFVRVGESSFTLDPLSSTGVEKAIQTGYVAGTVAHTMITRPERKQLCMTFYQERQREATRTHQAWSVECYRKVERFGDSPFWRRRSQPLAGVQDSRYPLETLSPDRELTAATRVRLAREARLVNEPCIIDTEVCERTAVLHPALGRPVAFVDGIELGRLLSVLPDNVDIETLVTLWSTRISSRQATRIAGWLIRHHVLECAPRQLSAG